MSRQRQSKRIGIIGAGMTGLVAAHRLLDMGFEVVLLESSPEAGGMLSSFNMGSDRIEYIYHHIFASDAHFDQLVRELGLQKQMSWHPAREALYANHILHPFSRPHHLMRFQAIPLRQRLQTSRTILRAGRLSQWQDLENQTAAEWLRRECGDKAYEYLWRPLLRAKFDLDADEISAVWVWNKFRQSGRAWTGRSGSSRLGYMKGGFGTLVGALVHSIERRGGQLLYGHTAMNITRDVESGKQPRYRVSCILENCSSVEVSADAIIATVSGRQFANISANLGLPDDYLKQVRSLHYKGDLCMILRLNKSLSPYYWTTVCDDLPFVVVVEHTNLAGSGCYGGNVIYLSRYLDVTDPLWTQPDGAIFNLFAQGLARMYPDFSPQDVIDWRLRRTRYAQPVISRQFSSRLPAMNTPEPGIKLAGMAQIYPEDSGMNFAVRLGERSACAIRQYFRNLADPC